MAGVCLGSFTLSPQAGETVAPLQTLWLGSKKFVGGSKIFLRAPLEQTEQLTVSVVSLRTGQPGSTYEMGGGLFDSRKETDLTKHDGHQSGQSQGHF